MIESSRFTIFKQVLKIT